MAGLSQRFTRAGYDKPKYMLEAHGRTLFDQAVLSFAGLFAEERFLFVAREVAGTRAFVEARCAALGIGRRQVVMLDQPTRGQAETVVVGLAGAAVTDEEPITIFNIDTFRPGFAPPVWAGEVDGYLETFEGEGSNWSFVRPLAPGSDRVAETSEKRPISRYCCTGLYQFAGTGRFRAAFEAEARRPAAALEGGELYVAPLYNRLLAEGADIRFTVVPRTAVHFCGVPDEYDAIRAAPPIY